MVGGFIENRCCLCISWSKLGGGKVINDGSVGNGGSVANCWNGGSVGNEKPDNGRNKSPNPSNGVCGARGGPEEDFVSGDSSSLKKF